MLVCSSSNSEYELRIPSPNAPWPRIPNIADTNGGDAGKEEKEEQMYW